MKILVTPRSLTRSGHPALSSLTATGFELVFSTPGKFPTEDELCALLPGCVGYLAGVEPVTARALASADKLKVISRNGTGIDNIDAQAAEKQGIIICRAEGANARGVAELTFAHILSMTRSLPFSDAAMKQKAWERRKGIELEGKTLGLVGCGRIGRIVAGFALAFGMRVLAYDPFPDDAFQPGPGFAFAPLEDVLPAADVISLHCPAQPRGTPLMDARVIATLKKGAYIVNTARGSLLDQAAVLKALDDGVLGGVAVDVFPSEPPEDWGLSIHAQAVSSPHIGGFTVESIHRAVSEAVKNMLKVLLNI